MKVLTPRNTPTLEPMKTGITICQAMCFQKKNTREVRDANARSGISGTAIVIGKTADPEANKIYTPPVANAALTNAAAKLPKVTIITDRSINLFSPTYRSLSQFNWYLNTINNFVFQQVKQGIVETRVDFGRFDEKK
jgi:hypothetical protein